MKMKCMIVAGLSMAATAIRAQEVWTLDQCIDYALTHSAAVLKSKVEANNARQDRGIAMGGLLPSVSASIGGQFSWGRNVDPETNTYNTITTFSNGYSVGGSITLFDGMQTWNEFRKAQIAVRQSDNALALARDEKAVEVIEKYVDVVYNDAATVLAEQKLDDSRLLLAKTKRMEELGEKSYPDVAQLEAQVADDEYSLAHQRTAAKKAVVELKRVMGMQLGENILVDSKLTLRARGLEDGLGLGERRKMGAKNGVATARLDYKIACGKLMPTLTLGGGVNTNYYKNLSAAIAGTSFSQQIKDNLGEYVYASLSIPLFNFPAYKRVKKARNNITLAEIELGEMQLNVNCDYRQAVLDRDGYIKEVGLMERKVANDSIAHHLNTRKYEEGLLSTFDLHTSALALHNSKVRLLQTKLMAEIKKRLVEYYDKEL